MNFQIKLFTAALILTLGECQIKTYSRYNKTSNAETKPTKPLFSKMPKSSLSFRDTSESQMIFKPRGSAITRINFKPTKTLEGSTPDKPMGDLNRENSNAKDETKLSQPQEMRLGLRKEPPYSNDSRVLKDRRLYTPEPQPTQSNSALKEESSYSFYDRSGNVPLYYNQEPDGGYNSYYLPSYDSNTGYANEKQDFGVVDDKEEYFYHKAKFISTAITSLFALGFTTIGVSVLTATLVANQARFNEAGNFIEDLITQKRSSSSTVDDIGSPLSLECLAKLMCEVEEADVLFTQENNKTNQSRENVTNSSDSQQKQRLRKRRQKRQLFTKRTCSKVYSKCPVNFSLLLNIYKYFTG